MKAERTHWLISLHISTPSVLASIVQHCATITEMVPRLSSSHGLPRTPNQCTSFVGAGMGFNLTCTVNFGYKRYAGTSLISLLLVYIENHLGPFA